MVPSLCQPSHCPWLLQACDEEKLLGHLGVVLYEYLGEEYPEVLGSILGALKAIVNVIGMTKMTPPIKDLLPRLTPILKNRHEKVCMVAQLSGCKGYSCMRSHVRHLHCHDGMTVLSSSRARVVMHLHTCFATAYCQTSKHGLSS